MSDPADEGKAVVLFLEFLAGPGTEQFPEKERVDIRRWLQTIQNRCYIHSALEGAWMAWKKDQMPPNFRNQVLAVTVDRIISGEMLPPGVKDYTPPKVASPNDN